MVHSNNSDKNERSFIVNAQYIKDMSFENPKAPYSLIQSDTPRLSMAIDVSKSKVEDNMYEVILHLKGNLLKNEELISIIEVQYGGLFTLQNLEDDKVLYVNCANFLFPFLRSIVADITQNSGFPSVLLAPIDFNGLYNEKISKKAEK